MTKPWLSDSQQRRSKRYQSKHAELYRDILDAKRSKSEDLKRERKRMKSLLFFRTAEV